ncbi:50S ribosomal protein L29 [Candidatus Pacearchaeota archaeon]|nr:50S ribosomal protein L29 [Candidatus Pacearchaeota archaeon]
MAIIRKKDISKMSNDEIKAKLAELRFELVKAGVTANKQNAKTKEIKRTISRLMTFSKFKDLLKSK